jgi:hypothetical protein
MAMQLTLPPQLEERLRQEAERRGEPKEAPAIRVLEQHLPQARDERRAAAIAMLKQWMEEDAAMSPEEERENLEVLRAIDEDRPSYRKLFTDILKDVPK